MAARAVFSLSSAVRSSTGTLTAAPACCASSTARSACASLVLARGPLLEQPAASGAATAIQTSPLPSRRSVCFKVGPPPVRESSAARLVRRRHRTPSDVGPRARGGVRAADRRGTGAPPVEARPSRNQTWPRARLIPAIRDSSSKGLRRYMTAPARRARSCVAASSWAVMNTTGMRRPAATRRSCSSNPLSPPRWTSSTKQPGVWGLRHSRKSSADEKVLTWKPPAPRRRRRALSSETSSSITHTSGERSSWRVEADADAKRPSLPGSTLAPVTPLRHALLVPYERVDWPGSRVLRVGRGRAVARQLDTECEPAIGVGFRHDTAAVGLDDRAADGQAHAEAARLRADEALEHALELRRFRADAGVADADLHAAGRPRRRYDPDLAGPVRGNTDRLARVHDQIQDHLLELDGIAGDERHDRVGGVDQRDVLARQVVAQQAHHLVDDLVQIEAALRRVLLAREGAEAPDDRRGALGVGGDVGQRLGHVGMYEARALEQAHRRLRVGHDGGERLVDLVGERGAELAERRDALGVRQPLALPAGLVLGVPPPRDVDVRDDRAAVRAPERLDRHLEPALDRLDATGVLEPRVVLLAGEDGGDGLEHPGCI